MAKQIFSSSPNYADDATFRASGQAISNALAALFVRVPQAGDINWTTVVRPSNAVAGSEIYRFNDSLQSTAPLFFKIEYATTGGQTRPMFYITVGKGADGAGNITSVLLARTAILSSAGGTTNTPVNSYIGSGDGSCFVMSLWPSDPAFSGGLSGSIFVLERSRDDSGNATAAAVFWYVNTGYSGAGVKTEAVDYVATTKNTTTYGCIPIPMTCSAGVSLSNGVTTPVFTGTVITPGRTAWVPTSIIGCARAEFGIGTVVSSLYNNIDYVALGAASLYSDMALQQYSAALIRWD